MTVLPQASAVVNRVETAHERHTWWVFGTMAAVGFCIGAFVYPMWTDNVESAQVQAGLVTYAPADVMGVYHSSVYSIVIQIAAVLLRAGVSEWTLSSVSSGLQGALSCAALAVVTLAISRNAVAALLVPVLLLRFRTTMPDWPGYDLAAFHGHHYPNLFPDHTSLYGVIGLFWIMLTFGFFGLSKLRTASVMLGLTPAVHVGLAPAALVGALGAVSVLPEWVRHHHRTIVRSVAIGLAVTAATALWHLAFHWTTSAAATVDVDRIARSFELHWDSHSALLGSSGWTWFFETEIYTAFLSFSLLTYGRRFIPAQARVIVIAIASITLVAVGYTVAVNVRPDLASWRLESLMITRWLNLSSFAFVVLALGVLANLALCERDLLAAALLAVVSGLVLEGYVVSITGAASLVAMRTHPIGTLRAYILPILIVVPCCVLATLRQRAWSPSYPQRFAAPLRVAVVVICVASLLGHQFSRVTSDRVNGRDGFTRALSELENGKGLVAVGDGLWIAGRLQLRTRRPLLLDPTQINLLLKVPSVGPRMAHVLDRVYGVPDFEGSPVVLDREWPRQPLEFWRAIGHEFGITQVLVRGDITLQLPKQYGDDQLAVYSIP